MEEERRVRWPSGTAVRAGPPGRFLFPQGRFPFPSPFLLLPPERCVFHQAFLFLIRPFLIRRSLYSFPGPFLFSRRVGSPALAVAQRVAAPPGLPLN
eukprot:scaffold27053_cov79-Isochrysis_galbana.AAC.1